MSKHVYVSNKASGFNFTVAMKAKKGKETRFRVKFEHKQFKTDDDKLADAIDKLIAENPAIARNIRKADKAAAEALAIQHAEMIKRTGAHKGGVTAEAAKHAMDTTLMQRDVELRSKNVDTAAFAEENLQMTEQAPEPAKEVVPEPQTEVKEEKPKPTIHIGK